MADWREIINDALADGDADPITLFRKYEEACEAAIKEAQSRLDDSWTYRRSSTHSCRRDPSTTSQLAALDAFSDKMHDGLLSDVNDIGLTIELLDAKGRVLTD